MRASIAGTEQGVWQFVPEQEPGVPLVCLQLHVHLAMNVEADPGIYGFCLYWPVFLLFVVFLS